jgi:hypothetical protein
MSRLPGLHWTRGTAASLGRALTAAAILATASAHGQVPASGTASGAPAGRLPGATTTEEPEPTAGYDDGFFLRSEDGKFKLKIGGRLESRFTYSSPTGSPDVTSFSISRARLLLSGNVLAKEMKYKFQADFGKGMPSLKDYYGDYAFVPGWLNLRAGQFKKPLSRDQITSAPDFQFNERSIANMGLTSARDIGVMFHNGYEVSPEGFEYELGAFNDTGETAHLTGAVHVDPTTGDGKIVDDTVSNDITNVPKFVKPGLVARLGYNSPKLKGYSEVDFEGGPLRVGFAGSAHLSFCGHDCTPAAGATPPGSAVARLDWIAKAYGFTTTGGGYLGFAQKADDWADMRYASTAFYLQAAFLILQYVQPAMRYARLHNDKGMQQEIGPALAVYFWRQTVAWRSDFLTTFSQKKSETTKDYLLRTQLQVVF